MHVSDSLRRTRNAACTEGPEAIAPLIVSHPRPTLPPTHRPLRHDFWWGLGAGSWGWEPIRGTILSEPSVYMNDSVSYVDARVNLTTSGNMGSLSYASSLTSLTTNAAIH